MKWFSERLFQLLFVGIFGGESSSSDSSSSITGNSGYSNSSISVLILFTFYKSFAATQRESKNFYFAKHTQNDALGIVNHYVFFCVVCVCVCLSRQLTFIIYLLLIHLANFCRTEIRRSHFQQFH